MFFNNHKVLNRQEIKLINELYETYFKDLDYRYKRYKEYYSLVVLELNIINEEIVNLITNSIRQIDRILYVKENYIFISFAHTTEIEAYKALLRIEKLLHTHIKDLKINGIIIEKHTVENSIHLIEELNNKSNYINNEYSNIKIINSIK